MNIEQPAVAAIVPAYNEEENILSTIKALKNIGARPLQGSGPINVEIIVADDCSTDNTNDIAKQTGVEVIRLNKNSGKGLAVNKALDTLRNRDIDILLLIDADIGESAVEAEKLIEPVIKKEASMAIAKIPVSVKKSGFGIVRWLARKSIKWKTGYEINSALSGQRAINFRDIKDYKFKSGYGLEVALTIDFLKKGKNIVEVEANMLHMGTGKDIKGFIHRGRQFYDILRTVWLSK